MTPEKMLQVKSEEKHLLDKLMDRSMRLEEEIAHIRCRMEDLLKFVEKTIGIPRGEQKNHMMQQSSVTLNPIAEEIGGTSLDEDAQKIKISKTTTHKITNNKANIQKTKKIKNDYNDFETEELNAIGSNTQKNERS